METNYYGLKYRKSVISGLNSSLFLASMLNIQGSSLLKVFKKPNAMKKNVSPLKTFPSKLAFKESSLNLFSNSI